MTMRRTRCGRQHHRATCTTRTSRDEADAGAFGDQPPVGHLIVGAQRERLARNGESHGAKAAHDGIVAVEADQPMAQQFLRPARYRPPPTPKASFRRYTPSGAPADANTRPTIVGLNGQVDASSTCCS